MRVPIEIDASLLLRLEEEARKSGQAVNDLVEVLLRKSLDGLAAAPEEKPLLRVKPRALHALPGIDFTSTSRLLDSLGEERYPG